MLNDTEPLLTISNVCWSSYLRVFLVRVQLLQGVGTLSSYRSCSGLSGYPSRSLAFTFGCDVVHINPRIRERAI